MKELERVSEEDGAFPFYSMVGISSPRTMLLYGVMRGRTVTVLIDSGVSYNFNFFIFDNHSPAQTG